MENPADCLLNVVLRKDKKGVSTIYSLLLNKNPSIVNKACTKWNEKIGESTSEFDFRKSFSMNSMFDDTYLRYIQFRTLHRRFFTNNILYKMRIKDSPVCNFCATNEDSIEHMLIECEIVQSLWHEIEEWIAFIGVVNYSIENSVIVLGELQKSFWINAIILITKKTIFNARINDTIPKFESIQTQVKNLYIYEKNKYTLLERIDKLEQRWGMLLEHYEE